MLFLTTERDAIAQKALCISAIKCKQVVGYSNEQMRHFTGDLKIARTFVQ